GLARAANRLAILPSSPRPSYRSRAKRLRRGVGCRGRRHATRRAEGEGPSCRGRGLPRHILVPCPRPSVEAADKQATRNIMTKAKSEVTTTVPGIPPPSPEQFINGLADLMAHSTRTPILRWPNEYGMEYEEVFFPALDGVVLEGWFIPADSDRLLIFNHPMPCNRYGYPRHLEPWTDFGGFEVNFLPEYKLLHDAGYNILTYDMRNHGL